MLGLLLHTENADACSFSMQYAAKIEPNDATISNLDRVEIAKLFIDAKNSAARNGAVVVYGFIEADRPSARAIANMRVDSAIAYLRQLGVSDARLNRDVEQLKGEATVPSSERDRLLIEFLPGENPCG